MSEIAVVEEKVRALVFPCGAENATEIYQSLRYSLHVELFGASSVEDHGRFRFPNYTGDLPRIQSPGFDAAFARLVREQAIDIVFATHDTVSEYLSPRAVAMGFHLINGDAEATFVARRKSVTYALFADRPWCPQTFAELDDVAAWPIVVKPDLGQGGDGVTKVGNPAEALAAISGMNDAVLVEYLPGEEITVDCFTDRHGKVLWVGPRTRERVRAGITMRSGLLHTDGILNGIASDINDKLKLRGPWFFQLKRDARHRWKLLEISCRVAGTMAAQRARGVNLPLMAVQDYLERDLTVLSESRVRLIDRSIATRAKLDFEFDTVFVDLDDTLIIDGHVTPQVIAFLYQMRQEGRQIILITRHSYDCRETLAKVCISSELFAEIIHITDGRSKADFVTKRSIFIDNHFPERLAVFREHGIPVFDVDTLEFFIK